MKRAVIYTSATGNTAKVAQAIFHALPKAEKEENCLMMMNDANAVAMAEEAELLFVGFWVDKGDCGEDVKQFLQRLHGKQIALFGTLGMGSAPEYHQRIAEKVISSVPKDVRVMGIFLCQGRMENQVRLRYEGMLEDDPSNEQLKGALRNFEEALSHPDPEDLKRAADFAREVAGK